MDLIDQRKMTEMKTIHGVAVHARHYTVYHSQRTDLIVRDDSGVEHKVDVDGDVSVRLGHRITALQLKDGDGRRSLLVFNRTTGEFASNAVVTPVFSWLDMCLAVPGGFVGFVVFFYLGFAVPAAYMGFAVGAVFSLGLQYFRWLNDADNKVQRQQIALIQSEFAKSAELRSWAKFEVTHNGFHKRINVLPL